MSLQITVFLAVHAKSLRNTSDFISALLEEFIFLFWDIRSLSPFIDLRYNPEWQLNVQETWQTWSWHSRVNIFRLSEISKVEDPVDSSQTAVRRTQRFERWCKRKDHSTPTARNIVSAQIWTRMTAASLALRVICRWFQL